MMTLPQVTAAPSSFVVNGRTFTMRPLTDADYGELEAWLQDRYIDMVQRNLSKLPKDKQDAAMDRAFDRASRITLGSPEGRQFVRSPECAIKMAWLCLRRDQPELTEQDVSDLLIQPDTIASVMRRIEVMERRAIPAQYRGPTSKKAKKLAKNRQRRR